MRRTVGNGVAVFAVAAVALAGASAWAQSGSEGRLFESLAGSWSGTGTATLSSGGSERIRCRADYQPSSPTPLHLGLRCASDSFNLQVASDVQRDGDRISGSWTETSLGVSGDLSGRATADRIDATVDGVGVQARLTLAVRGNAQVVNLTSDGQLASSASVTMRRQ